MVADVTHGVPGCVEALDACAMKGEHLSIFDGTCAACNTLKLSADDLDARQPRRHVMIAAGMIGVLVRCQHLQQGQ